MIFIMILCCRWEGEGNDKRWVVDETTCSCGQVTRETRVQVPFLDCRLAKRKECRWGILFITWLCPHDHRYHQECPGDPVPQGS